MKEARGTAFIFGNDINTDVILPGKYLNVTDPDELASHCMESEDPDFVKKIKPGDIMVVGSNFGCGSSREHAPLSIKYAGISCVIASTFARIFFRKGIPFSFYGTDMYNNGMVEGFCLFDDPCHHFDIMSVKGAQVSDPHIFKDHAGNDQLL